MVRFFSVFLLSLALLFGARYFAMPDAQPVFFRLYFPQLMPSEPWRLDWGWRFGEAVRL